MNNKHKKILLYIFQKPVPVPVDLKWRSVASLIKALGGDIRYGDGSRIRIDLKGKSVNIHSPYPQKELHRYAVRLIKELLGKTGNKP
ncbi:MAG: type II toxin-antitoxin system HicA family toxin [Thermodesulfobacteriota bacterium]|nr:type II toxin-antitoxin system HicA family toxin [Thermodesulfobacteriota bacterium]